MSLKTFYINESFLISVYNKQTYGIYDGIPINELSKEQFLKVMTGEDRVTVSSTGDHPEFTKLRNQLEDLGYIKTERSWNNGDYVLKGFKLNEWTFKKGQKFWCASAMKISIEVARKSGQKSM